MHSHFIQTPQKGMQEQRQAICAMDTALTIGGALAILGHSMSNQSFIADTAKKRIDPSRSRRSIREFLCKRRSLIVRKTISSTGKGEQKCTSSSEPFSLC